MQEILNQIQTQATELFGPHFLRIVGALLILIGGWLTALLVASLVRRGLKKTTLDNRLARLFAGAERAETLEVERIAGRIVYYLILVLALVGFFNALDLTVISEPLTSFLNQVFGYLPRLGAGALLIVAAIAVATILRRAVAGALARAKLDERMGGQAGIDEEKAPPLSKTLGDAVYWLAFLLFLPAVLGTLGLEGLLQPVQGLVDRILGYLPSVLAATVVLLVGWFVARIVQRIVTNLLGAIGLDGVAERVGLDRVLGENRLSSLVGLLIYILILIPVLISALNALALEAITAPASDMLSQILEAIPALFAATLLLVLAFVVGRLAGGLVANLLAGIGFNNVLVRLSLASKTVDEGRSPSAVVGSLIVVAVMLFGSVEAARLLGFDALSELLAGFIVVASQILLGLVLFGVGLYLANLAAGAIREAGVTHARIMATAARVTITVLAGAIALRQMGLANEIIELGFGILVGSVAVAAAIAFGLGGRDVAGQQLESWMEQLRKESD